MQRWDLIGWRPVWAELILAPAGLPVSIQLLQVNGCGSRPTALLSHRKRVQVVIFRARPASFELQALAKKIAHKWKACLVWRLIDFLKKLFCSIFISAGLLMFYCVLSLCVHLYSNLLEVSLQRHALLKANLSSVSVILRSKQLSLIGIHLYLDWCEITLVSYSDKRIYSFPSPTMVIFCLCTPPRSTASATLINENILFKNTIVQEAVDINAMPNAFF